MKGICKDINLMLRIDHMIVDTGGEVYCFSADKRDVVAHGYIQSVQNLFPEVPQSFKGLIVQICSDDEGKSQYRTLKLNPKDDGLNLDIEFFNNLNAPQIVSDRMRRLEMEITLAKMWRLGLSDETKSEILSVYKNIKRG